MTEYIKNWLSLDDQIQKLVSRGVAVPDLEEGKCVPSRFVRSDKKFISERAFIVTYIDE